MSWLISSFACLPLQCLWRCYAKHRWALWFSSHLGFGAAAREMDGGNSNTFVATATLEKPEQSSFTFIVWNWNSLGVISFPAHIWNFCTNLALLHHILNTFNMWQWFPLQVCCLGLQLATVAEMFGESLWCAVYFVCIELLFFLVFSLKEKISYLILLTINGL